MEWSEGGTSIDPDGYTNHHWTADYELLDNLDNSLLLHFERQIRNHINLYGTLFDIRAFLWHQGEGDSQTGPAARYYDNLKNMIAYVRGVVGNSQLPFICGTVPHASGQYNATVEAAFHQLDSEDDNFYLVDLSGAPLQDAYHFNSTASIYFG